MVLQSSYFRFDNVDEHKSILQKVFGIENVLLEYTTPHAPQLNRVIKRRLSVIKEVWLAMLINAKLNYTAQKILWEEAFHTCEIVEKQYGNYRQY